VSCLDSIIKLKEFHLEKLNCLFGRQANAATRSTKLAAIILGSSALTMVAMTQPTFADVLIAGDLIVSMTTYQDQGAVANLVAGSSGLPGGTAAADGTYPMVWNNAAVDSSFGVTSAITLQTVTQSGTVVNTLNINPNQVATSFSSKSELALNIAPNGQSVSFIGYAGAGVGALDVSNSDAPGIPDSTNPVTSFFGSASNPYAFARTITTVSANGTVTYTPTQAYGGNNGRAVILGTNGQYYTVGNSNNGASTTFNNITQSTGLESFTPLNASSATGTAPLAPNQVDPTFISHAGDKAGKDSNFRGLTEYGGNLYFTKGSGSNGLDTVYTVTNPRLPTSSAGTISVLPGFPTTYAKTTADFTPFGLFFANSTTLYVADEGSGDAIDASLHAGLEKWSLVNGVWQLDYTLQTGLIGDIFTLCPDNSFTTGCAGAYYKETLSGLRNITGEVNADGTVTIWGVTADTSGSGDNGADPDEIVKITDELADTTLPTSEEFTTFEGPQYGVVYRGVAFEAPEPFTLSLFGAGLMGAIAMGRKRKKSA
jgi:hypothetical protein